MAFGINEFKAQLVGGGARSSLFQVQITNPILGVADFKLPFMCKSASLPSSDLGTITTSYFGRTIKFHGERSFQPWSVQIINDEDFAVRNAMEAWSNAMNSHVTNLRVSPQEYKSDAIITQFAQNGSVLRVYNFQGLFPTSIEAIPMSWEAENQIQEFGVTFEYDLWTISGGTTGNSTN